MEYINIRKLCIIIVVLLYYELLLQLQMHCCSCNHTKVATVRGDVNICLVIFVPYPDIRHNVIKVVTFYIPITSCHVSVYYKTFLLKVLNTDFRFL
jgi:hypothetical protein